MAEKRDWPFLNLLILEKDKISVPDIFSPYVKKIFDQRSNFRQKLSFLSMEKNSPLQILIYLTLNVLVFDLFSFKEINAV